MKTQVVIFGLTGDLGRRKLLPALDHVLQQQLAKPKDLEIIGISRRQISTSDVLEQSLGQDQSKKSSLSSILSFHTMNLADLDDYIVLKSYLASRAAKAGWQSNKTKTLFYLSVPPSSAAKISELLGKAGLNSPQHKILFEKPFGVDLASAQDFFNRTEEYFTEQQILRVDHYLMKAPIRKLQALFEANQILAGLFKEKQIQQIEIIGTETLDIEGRAIFYEQTGALRDFVQNHLASILATILAGSNPNYRAARASALAKINNLLDISAETKRAQYIGYRKEVASPNSTVETYCTIKLSSKDPQWQGVDFVLVHGKALATKNSQIKIHFTNQKSKPITIDLSDDKHATPPYAQVFLDAIRGDRNFFVSQREILESWRIFDPILKAWEFDAQTGLDFYKKGSNIN